MKTITLFSREFPPVLLGGIGNTARFLAEELSNSSYKVNVITPKFGEYSHLPSFEKRGNITIYRLKLKQRLLFWSKTAPFSYFNKKILKNTDLIHILNARDAPFIYKKSPVIANINDYYPLTIPLNPFRYPYREKGKLIKYLNYNLFKFLDYTSLKRADFIVYNNRFAKNLIEKRFKLKNKKSRVIYKGIDVKEFNGRYRKEFDVMFAGSPLGSKGAIEFINAIMILKNRNKKINAVMIGRPSEIDYDYRKIIKKAGLETNIKFIGFVKHGDLIKYFLKSEIYALPSHRESLAQTLMEAMAAKLPVIATNVGGNPEIINGKNGFLIEPMKVAPLAEKISYLLENPNIRKEMGNNGYELVENKFNFKRMIKEYMEIYNRFL